MSIFIGEIVESKTILGAIPQPTERQHIGNQINAAKTLRGLTS
jgi:hypothetical protein